MTFLRTFIARFFTQTPPELHLAIFSPSSSVTIEKYINMTVTHLKATLNRPVVVTQFSNITNHSTFNAFARQARNTRFDMILAISALPAQQARRLYTEHGIFIPTLVITYEEFLPHPLPKHISALFLKDNAPLIHHLVREYFENITTVLICARSTTSCHSIEFKKLKTLLNKDSISCELFPLDKRTENITQRVTPHLNKHTLLYLPMDTLAFSMMPDLIALSHEHGGMVMTSELDSITYGADLAVGYPMNRTGRETAERLAAMTRSHKQELRYFKTSQEVHCHLGSNISWLNSLTNQEVSYHFKIIGATNSARSAQSQPATPTQSTKQ